MGDPIADYWKTGGVATRTRLAIRIVGRAGPEADAVLHHFLELAADDPDAMNRSQDYWAVLAEILVRFGMADTAYWYGDGPAPNREWIAADVQKYLGRS